ncbi:hypothetical protein H2203_005478 [Taxawa tesnikishii (nom. ined.)]|nr:hypothetical protein H2203_005478 [Dothideales sp. JES 119]
MHRSIDCLRSVSSSSSVSLASSSPPSSPDLSALEDSGYFESNGEDEQEFVMVVGGAGYIGSHTTLELLKAGYNVLCIDDLSNSFDHVFTNIKTLAAEHCENTGVKMPALRFHKLDYRSFAMRSLLAQYAIPSLDSSAPRQSRIVGVIHFAAFKSVEESINKPLAYYQNNISGLIQLLAWLEEFNIRNFVFSSSATVYGIKANEGKPLKEEDLVHFIDTYVDENGEEQLLIPGVKGLTSPYGRTKYFAEAILADVAKADPSWRITALRYFNPVGCHPSGILREDPRQKPTNLFPVIAQVLTGSRPVLDVFGSDWETRDGTAHAFRAYNLGTGNGATVAEVVDAMSAAAGREIPVQRVGRRAGDVGFCVAATERAERELQWRTEMSLSQCAEDTWRALAPLASS